MSIFRSRRLEAVFGTRINADALKHHHIERLVTGSVPEATDLDFKRDLYDLTGNKRLSLPGDVAAQANTQGGVIIVGVEENRKDGFNYACDVPGVQLSSKTEEDMLQFLGVCLAPFPHYEIISVPDPNRRGIGCYVIAIPRSPRAPIGVLLNHGYRWPRRNGTTTYYLSESEIESAYRARFARVAEQSGRADVLHREVVGRLHSEERGAWLVLTVVPDLPGEMVIDHRSFDAFQKRFAHADPILLLNGSMSRWQRVTPAYRRILLDAGLASHTNPRVNNATAELHDDGAAVFAIHLADMTSRHTQETEPAEASPVMFHDEALVIGILSGLKLLGTLARDIANAAGPAALRVTLVSQSAHDYALGVGTPDHGGVQPLGAFTVRAPLPIAERAADLDDLAYDGPGLIQAGSLLCGDLMRMFGEADVLQLTRNGSIRIEQWGTKRRTLITEWATAAGITVISDQEFAAEQSST
jgi:hypothetical protein